MKIKIEVTGRGLWGVFSDNGVKYHVGVESRFDPREINDRQILSLAENDPWVTMLMGVEFETRIEAIDYIRQQIEEACKADALKNPRPEIDYQALVRMAPDAILEKLSRERQCAAELRTMVEAELVRRRAKE